MTSRRMSFCSSFDAYYPPLSQAVGGSKLYLVVLCLLMLNIINIYMSKTKEISAEEFDYLFDAGEDLTPYLDMSSVRRPNLKTKQINIELTVRYFSK